MASPFPVTTSIPGQGNIQVEVAPSGVHTLSKLSFTYPLKLISPTAQAQGPSEDENGHSQCVVVFVLSYGGGLVSGDSVLLEVLISEHARLCLLTQGSTKVFKHRDGDEITRQSFSVKIEANAALILLPDPIQPFANSLYEQHQKFVLRDATSSLVVLDWISEGRSARGESWDFTLWTGRNEVWKSSIQEGAPDRLILRDNIVLDQRPANSGENSIKTKMQKTGVLGTLIIVGPKTEPIGKFFIKEFSLTQRIGGKVWSSDIQNGDLSAEETWRTQRQAFEVTEALVWTAASIRGCTLVKFTAPDVQTARNWLRDMLSYERTIEQQFGEGCLFCLR
jgi:urease accessory protein